MKTWQNSASSRSHRDGYFWSVLRRLPGTMAVWAFFGIAAGICLASPEPSLIKIIAMCIAGLIVFVPLGGLLALVGAGWRELLLGGSLGMVAAFAAALIGDRPDAAQFAAVGLTFGGLLGGTVLTVAYRLPRLVLAQLRKLITAPAPKDRAMVA